MAKRKIILFEDKESERSNFCAELKKSFGKYADIIPFEPTNKIIVETYEAKINEELKNVIKDIALIITDRDLSQYRDSSKDYNLSGLSASVITAIANYHAIPICLYAGEDQSSQPKLTKIRDWSDYKIILDIKDGYPKVAAKCKVIFDGFESIRKMTEKILSKKPTSPAQIMAKILAKPELQDRIALYGVGDQHFIEDILPYSESDIKGRIPRLLGYWLWDSILRYPGLLVFEEAAASYLNIDSDDFKNPKVKSLFEGALYKGPFAERQEYWWRSELDRIIYDDGCSDGFDLAKRKKLKVKECKCFVDPTIKAGYYCMINKKPVSDKNSKSNISWFPPGADLARIATKEFNKLAPWIGLY